VALLLALQELAVELLAGFCLLKLLDRLLTLFV
jgi:hypothetical protein